MEGKKLPDEGGGNQRADETKDRQNASAPADNNPDEVARSSGADQACGTSQGSDKSPMHDVKHGFSRSSYDWHQVLGSFRKKLQRHPSSYEQDPDDDTPPEKATKKSSSYAGKKPTPTSSLAQVTYEPPVEDYPDPLIVPSTSIEPLIEEVASAEGRSMVFDACPKTIFRQNKDPAGEIGEAEPLRRVHPHFRTLSRLPRIESETELVEKENILQILKNSVLKNFSDDSKSETKSPEDRRTVDLPETKASPSTGKVLRAPKTLKIDTEVPKMKKLTNEKSADSHESTSHVKTPEKESRTWIPKSVSKILSDKNSSSSADKKRAKSPSSILEFAQRKLPKWATFSRKSDEDNEPKETKSKPEKPQIEQATTPTKKLSDKTQTSKSSDDSSQNQPVIPYIDEIDPKVPKSHCRWYVSDDETQASSKEEPMPITKSASSEPLEPTTSTSKSTSFSIFKGKDHKRPKSPKPEKKSPSTEKKQHEKMPVPTTLVWDADDPKDKKRTEVRKSRSCAADYKDTEVKSKEKGKFFSKQKSRDTSAGPSRKNSLKFSNIKNRWFKSSKEKKAKDISAEGLDNIWLSNSKLYAENEFLVSSLQVLLIVSPASQRLELRSRSLNNLDSVLSHKSRYGLKREPQVVQNYGNISAANFVSSEPNLTALKQKDGLKCLPGPTRGRSAFVRRNHKLKHTHSQGAYRDFFRVSIPQQHVEPSKSYKKTAKKEPNLPNIVYVPAAGNVSVREAVVAAIPGEVNFNTHVLHLAGTTTCLPIDATNACDMAGRTLVLEEKKPKKSLFNKSSFRTGKTSGRTKFFSRSTEESGTRGRSPAPSSTATPGSSNDRHESKGGGLTQMINQLLSINIFGSKTDPVKMEKLEQKLIEFGAYCVPILPDFKPYPLSKQTYETLQAVQGVELESICDISNMSEKEVNRQRVILEMITTEASYIAHIRTVIELFYSTAHALQKEGIMKEVKNKRLFSNICDILNVNLEFWCTCLYPMFAEAVAKKQRFNTQLLYDGFMSFSDMFKPYETFVYAQKDSQTYGRHLMASSAIYTAYLTWCESRRECKRLKLLDIMVKPMQRLTKYTLLLKAIYDATDYEPEKTTIFKMHHNVKSYISNVNIGIRYKEECETMDVIIRRIEGYDVFEKEEDLDDFVRQYLDLNLRGPMPGCDPRHRRSLILQGDVKIRDFNDSRLCEIRAFLLTDMLLACCQAKKKHPEDEVTYRVIRQKFMVDKLKVHPQYVMKDGKEEISSLLFVLLDETGTAVSYFTFSESSASRDANNPTLKMWNHAIKEAKSTIKLARKYYKDPKNANIDPDIDYTSESDMEEHEGLSDKVKKAIRRSAREHVACMMHGASISAADLEEASTSTAHHGGKSPWKSTTRGRSRGSSRASRLSSLQQSYSGSYDMTETGPGPSRRIGSADTSIDRRTISMSSDEWLASVNQQVDLPEFDPTRPTLRPRSPSQRFIHRAPVPPTTPNTLTVQPMQALGQSMPDLASGQICPAISSSIQIPQVSLNVPKDPNKQMYLRAGPPAGALAPDNRGTSYPPPSPTRASLRRGFAFSSTFKNPLVKSKHISKDVSPLSGSVKFEKTPLKAPPSSPYNSESSPPPPTVVEAINVLPTGSYLIPPSVSTMDSDNEQNLIQSTPDVEKKGN